MANQFVESLSAPKRFLNSITIEPVAFIAILALYIEFPSIQDLIYTKVCLQVVAEHTNLTQFSQTTTAPSLPNVSQITTSTSSFNTLPPRIQTGSSLGAGNLSVEPIEINMMHNITQLPSTAPGRIIQPNFQDQNRPFGSEGNQLVESRDHIICDRLNKSALPMHIKQLITDGDSLFWFRYQLIICGLCALCCPYWGGVSDKIGRIIPLNVPIIMSTISNMISLAFGLLISLDSHSLFQLEWLYIGAFLIGISGGQAIVIVNSFGFISDNTSIENRSKRVVILESVMYISHSVGFYITKHIMSLGLESPQRPWLNRHFVAFSLCTALNIICLIYSFLKLRHHRFHTFLNNFQREQQEAFAGEVPASIKSIASGSLSCSGSRDLIGAKSTNFSNADRLRDLTASTPDDLDGPIVRSDKKWTDWGVVFTFNYYRQTYEVATKKRDSRPIILMLILCGFISAMCLTSLMSLLYIYVFMEPFNWSTSDYSLWNSYTSITRGAALIGLTLCMKFVKSWNIPDPIVAAVGFLSKGVGLLMIGTAHSSSMINWALLAFVLSEYSMPPLRSLLSKLVVKEELGKLYSCLAAVQSICFLLGNVIFHSAYTSLGQQDFYRLSFIIVAGFQFVGVVIMLLIYTTLRGRFMIV